MKEKKTCGSVSVTGPYVTLQRNDRMNRLKINPQFPYVYETHLHTSEASACARNTGDEMARACHEAGYTGIMVTNHFYYGNTCVDRKLPLQEWVEAFCKGYEAAKAEGDRIGLQVFFGWEAAYRGTEFLVYGLNKEWLISHPEIKDATIEEQYEMVHRDGGMVIHAHPFRKENYIPEIRLFPELVDGVEAVNATHSCKLSGCHNDPFWDEQAKQYAAEHRLPMTAGSDVHGVELLYGGIAFSDKLTGVEDYMKAVRENRKSLLMNGNESV